MAIKGNYENGDIFAPNAYYKITKLLLSIETEEVIVDNPGGFSNLEIRDVNRNLAYVMVYADEQARKNGAYPIGKLAIEFEYQKGETANVWENAYIALKNTERLQNSIFEDC